MNDTQIGPKLLLSAAEAGDVMGVDETTIRKMWCAGDLPFIRIGRGRKVTRQWLEEYIEAHKECSRAP
ncbi:helix-turn-helix domain-containing protein [Rhodococcus ruber]|uniref:helix-turn-helix domain-containing protein n=1 Tax=Rhodococcus ruber TaxID=1830 RepID=UPI0019322C7E|nr:helix-turn-helix domain-containing protein [Rhodococcus ruber]QRE79173.1 helix-turn-helix domain-containing protein [Rhodococcus ruber]